MMIAVPHNFKLIAAVVIGLTLTGAVALALTKGSGQGPQDIQDNGGEFLNGSQQKRDVNSELPESELTINGVPVPLDEGTKKITVGNTEAEVKVSKDQNQSGDNGSKLNISVESHTTDGRSRTKLKTSGDTHTNSDVSINIRE